ncbi:hypothetical protein DFQ30_008449 [Apophysomyces sp. BC1015]|nr:hypothetical protein DFQ30_008449 [Apophysomyces sp. BC1015]
MPQVIKNYRLGTAESLSFSFLVVWLTGDVANLIGCRITGQLPFQLYLSIYFIAIDTFLCIQWLYYVRYPDNALRLWFNPPQPAVSETKPTEYTHLLLSTAPSTASASTSSSSKNYNSTALFMLGLFSLGNISTNLTSMDTTTLSAFGDEHDRILWIGRFFAWTCTFLYLSSRLPQIYQNFRRRSVEGLAMSLFGFAAMGNLTYCLSIFTNPHATRASMMESVPYILGSAGTLVFDATIFSQYLFFKNNDVPEKDEEVL